MTLADDLCDISMTPSCDGNSNFRTIDGRCNNLGADRKLWGSMSISLRRYLPRITSLYLLDTYFSKPSSRSMDWGHGVLGKCIQYNGLLNWQ